MISAKPPMNIIDLPDAEDLKRLTVIRAFEFELLELFSKGILKGTTHTCIGQEYIPVSLQALLRSDDFVFSNHRGHGHYLARYDDVDGLLAEILGREGAVCKGVGGSQHIFRENYLSTGIQGESIPIATGVALHLKRKNIGALALTYIGDGTWGEGSVYEGLNMARLWKLPLVVVVENNGIAQTTAREDNMAASVESRAAGFGISYAKIEHCDIQAIRLKLKKAVERLRSGAGPLIVEFITTRLASHSKGDDTRDSGTLEQLEKQDLLKILEDAYPEEMTFHRKNARLRISESVQNIRKRLVTEWCK